MKSEILTYLVLLLSTFVFAAEPADKVAPKSLIATAYPAHVEITWANTQGFDYEIYRLTEGNRKFEKCTESEKSVYLDFIGDGNQGRTVTYRVVPKGFELKNKDAKLFEVSVKIPESTDEALLDMTQRYTTRYFYNFADPVTGMARERSNDVNGNIVTTGGTGFGIMALVAGAERNYFSHEQAFATISKIVGFLEKAERFHGAWSHWYNADSGKSFSFSKYDNGGDLVETAFLTQGLLTARQYFFNGKPEEMLLSNRITQLWESVEWNWYTQGTDSLYWHWSKDYGWKMNHRIKGFDETMITYVLAASSPTYPISKKVYESCYKKSPYYYNGKTYYGIKLDLGMEYGGPLFFTHYSFLGLNPNGLTDGYTDYFERNKAHVLIHRAYAIDNPEKHKDYGADLWGFTSSDDPLVGYTSHHPGTPDENGTVSPTAALSSIVYTPKESLQVLRHLYLKKGAETFGKYGFYDAYNPELTEGRQVVRSYLAIDQGPIAVMIENYRSGLIWKLFMSNPEIHTGLEKLGFKTDN
ncbi:MAG: glucoamylase family protein [Paludibacter sp.]|nr:glucoamylase family protein [Paludibacter sp.]